MPPQFNDDDDDELLEGLDDDDVSGAPVDAEFEQKYAEFMREVDKHINIIMKPKQFKPAERLESVRILGELGEIKAIKALVTVYQKDKAPGIKEAAAKSLAMFKALQEAIEDEDDEIRTYASNLLDGIVRRRELGKSSRMAPRTLKMVMGALVVSMIVLFALGFVLSGTKTAQAEASLTEIATRQGDLPTDASNVLTPSDVAGVAKLLSTYYISLSQDIGTLQTQMRAITQQKLPDCAAAFQNPTKIFLPAGITAADDADLANAVVTLQSAGDNVSVVRDAFTNGCAGGSITRDDANGYADALTNAQSSLKDIPALLKGAGAIVPPTPTPPTPTEPPPATATPTNTLVPTATINPDQVNAQVRGMSLILDQLMGARGSNTTLLAYWTDVLTTGSTGGCLNLPPPVLPDNYVVPEPLDTLIPELAQAAISLNTGLELSRSSWQAFAAACSANNLGKMAVDQSPIAQRAQDNFKDAKALVDSVK